MTKNLFIPIYLWFFNWYMELHAEIRFTISFFFFFSKIFKYMVVPLEVYLPKSSERTIVTLELLYTL